jgi:hypothetical protein
MPAAGECDGWMSGMYSNHCTRLWVSYEQTAEGDATSIRPFEDENLLVNMSVWRDVESLNEYVYGSVHVEHAPSP